MSLHTCKLLGGLAAPCAMPPTLQAAPSSPAGLPHAFPALLLAQFPHCPTNSPTHGHQVRAFTSRAAPTAGWGQTPKARAECMPARYPEQERGLDQVQSFSHPAFPPVSRGHLCSHLGMSTEKLWLRQPHWSGLQTPSPWHSSTQIPRYIWVSGTLSSSR